MEGGWDRADRVGLQFAATSKLVRPGNHYYLLHNLFLYLILYTSINFIVNNMS